MQLKTKENRAQPVVVLPLVSLLLDKHISTQIKKKHPELQVVNTKISSRIQNKIYADENFSGIKIKVTFIQNTVVLSGAVDTRYQKIRAQRIAKNDKGVELIINSLRVRG